MRATIRQINEAMNALVDADTTAEDRQNWIIITDAVNELELARKALEAWVRWNTQIGFDGTDWLDKAVELTKAAGIECEALREQS